jgi:enterochelin esterase-like enzyme
MKENCKGELCSPAILNNQTINSTLLYFSPCFKRKEKKPPMPGTSLETPAFKMLQPCKNLGDGRVRITYYNPDAKTAEVFGNGGSMPDSYPMAKDEDGYWSAEFESNPGIHVHRYRVDGAVVSNPVMPYTFNSGEPANVFETVDDGCDWYLMKDVPHGDLRMDYYRSSFTGRWKVCWTYTPPGYEQNLDKKYPVLYLQHGAGEDETGWIDMGKTNYILDNMLSEGKCEEMLVVMNSGFAYKEGVTDITSGFTQELLCDCIPFIEERYRVIADGDHRAVAGLSMGSVQAQRIVHENPDMFAYAGVIIGGFTPWNGGPAFPALTGDVPALNKKLKVFFAANGEEEPQCEAARAAIAELKAKGLEGAVFYFCPGYHELTVCRNSLREFLPLLFK